MATDAILVHPDHILGFDADANASDHQLGAVASSMEDMWHVILGNSLLHKRTAQPLTRNS